MFWTGKHETNYKNKTWNFRVLAVRMDVRNETKSEFSMRSHSLPGCVVGIARSSVGFERCDSLRSLVISTKGTSSCASVPHGGMTWSWTFWGTYTAPFLEHPMLMVFKQSDNLIPRYQLSSWTPRSIDPKPGLRFGWISYIYISIGMGLVPQLVISHSSGIHGTVFGPFWVLWWSSIESM